MVREIFYIVDSFNERIRKVTPDGIINIVPVPLLEEPVALAWVPTAAFT